MIANRIGIFRWAAGMIQRDPEGAAKIFQRLGAVVVRAELMYYNNSIEYTAMSHLFDEVQEGAIPPIYEVTAATTDDGEISVSVRKAV